MKKFMLIVFVLSITLCFNSSALDEVFEVADEDSGSEATRTPVLRNNTFQQENGRNGKFQQPQNNSDIGSGSDAVGDVFLHSGGFCLTAVDLGIPSRGFPFRFERTYKSQINYNGPLGYNWDFNYNMHLAPELDGGGIPTGNIFVISGNGRKDLYIKNPDNSYRTPPGFYNRLIKNPDESFTLKNSHGLSYNFYRIDNSVVSGALMRIEDRNGNALQLSYTNGLLDRVTDTVGRIIRFFYDRHGRIIAIRDFHGREVRFTYNAAGDLIAVCLPANAVTPSNHSFSRITKYTYASLSIGAELNHNLLTITRPNEAALNPVGPAVLINTFGTNPQEPYTYDKIIQQDFGGGRLTYFYEELNPGADPNDLTISRNKTTVVDRVGNVAEYQHNIKGNRLELKEFTGRVDPLNPVLPPTGKLRPTDPDYFVTAYRYNINQEQIKRTSPSCTHLPSSEGNIIERIYDDTNPNVLQQGNLLSVKERPYELAPDSESIITNYTYESNFNFVKTKTNPRDYITANYYDYEEAALGDLNGDGITDQASGNLVMIEYPQITLGVETPPQIIQEKFTYNDYGQILKHIAGEGNVKEFIYYPATGYLYKSILGSGSLNLTTEYTYDAVGNVTSVKDPKENITHYLVNSLNQVVKVTSPAPFNYEKFNYYDANGNLIRVDIQNKDKDGNIVLANPWFTTANAYNILDNLVSKTEEINETQTITTNYEYDANDNLKRTIQPLGNKVLTTYDERDLTFQKTRGEGTADASTTTQNYDLNGNVSQLIDGRGYLTTYNYDGFNRLVETIDAKGNIASQTFDKASNVTQTQFQGNVDHNGTFGILAITNYFYDEINRQYQKDELYFDPPYPGYHDTKTTQNFYNRNNNIYKMRDARGNDTQYNHDQANRLTLTTDAQANEYRYFYDANSNISQDQQLEISQLGNPPETFTNTYTFDNLNRLVQTTDNLGQSRYLAYDSMNNLVFRQDAKGNTTNLTYDGLARKLTTVFDLRENGQGGYPIIDTITLSQTWDDNSRLLSQTDDNSNTTSYQYDSLNRFTQVVHQDGTHINYAYDANDNSIQVIDPNGSVINNTYDEINRLTHRDINRAPGVGGTTWENYGYSGLSMLTLAQDDDSQAFFRYDSLGYLRNEWQGPFWVESFYEPMGLRTYFQTPDYSPYCVYNYDALNRVRQITGFDDQYGVFEATHYRYIGPHRVEKKESWFGNVYGQFHSQSLPTYDGARRVVKLRHESLPEHTTLAEFEYGYDPEDNQLYEQKNHTPWNGSGDVDVYDSLYRLGIGKVNVEDPVAESEDPGSGGEIGTTIDYSLDGVGNRTRVTTNDIPVDYIPNNVNEYTDVGGITLAYDNNGNLKERGIYRFVYDYRNQLIEIGTYYTFATYEYDALGRRIKKDIQGEPIEKYYYDGWDLLAAFDDAGQPVANYLYGPEPYGLGPNEVLSMRTNWHDGHYAHYCYFLQNVLGSITHVTDNWGIVREQYDYNPFGTVTIRDEGGNVIPDSQIGNTRMFRGMQNDFDLGGFWQLFGTLYYDGSNYYDSGIGRYWQPDPNGTWANYFNLGSAYTFAGNNPQTINISMDLSLSGLSSNQSSAGTATTGIDFSGYYINKAIEEAEASGTNWLSSWYNSPYAPKARAPMPNPQPTPLPKPEPKTSLPPYYDIWASSSGGQLGIGTAEPQLTKVPDGPSLTEEVAGELAVDFADPVGYTLKRMSTQTMPILKTIGILGSFINNYILLPLTVFELGQGNLGAPGVSDYGEVPPEPKLTPPNPTPPPPQPPPSIPSSPPPSNLPGWTIPPTGQLGLGDQPSVKNPRDWAPQEERRGRYQFGGR